ncbi:hypothetical protein PANA5342_3927 [Pantoea ananatis LMG 5342]|nr:hypothetical protein PANA5342_2631 [Pantoea ananatis LMG 5342]CCF11320.1 hypothetical protein PANA5342_3927 [Pantoea ananatis LMG 5342]
MQKIHLQSTLTFLSVIPSLTLYRIVDLLLYGINF